MLLYARRGWQAASGVGPWSPWGGQSVLDPRFVRGCFGFSCGCGNAAARLILQTGGALAFKLVLPGIQGMLGDGREAGKAAG